LPKDRRENNIARPGYNNTVELHVNTDFIVTGRDGDLRQVAGKSESFGKHGQDGAEQRMD
jgi:hypothetical protein